MDSVMMNRLRDGAMRAVVNCGTQVVSCRVGSGGEGGTCYTDWTCLDKCGSHSRDSSHGSHWSHRSHRASGDYFSDRDWRHQGSCGNTKSRTRHWPVEAGARDHSVEARVRDYSCGARARDHSVEARARNHSCGARDHSGGA